MSEKKLTTQQARMVAMVLYGRDLDGGHAVIGQVAHGRSRVHHPAAPVPAMIGALRAQLEELTGARFNSVLANLYRDGNDSVTGTATTSPSWEASP